MKPPGRLQAIGLICGLILSARAASLPEPRGKRVLEPFDYQGVRLRPGRLMDQMDEVRRF